jgi:hypothetical protein
MSNEILEKPEYQPDKYERQRIQDDKTIRIAGIFFVILSVVLALAGFVLTHQGNLTLANLGADFYANVSTSLASIAITVLVAVLSGQAVADTHGLNGQSRRRLGVRERFG